MIFQFLVWFACRGTTFLELNVQYTLLNQNIVKNLDKNVDLIYSLQTNNNLAIFSPVITSESMT